MFNNYKDEILKFLVNAAAMIFTAIAVIYILKSLNL